MAAVIDFLQLEPPREPRPQPAVQAALPVAKSALFVAINGLVAPSYLRWCLACDDGGGGGGGLRRRCFRGEAGGDVEQMWYQMASFATAVLGVALLAFHVASSSAPAALAAWLVWLTKVFTCGTLQFGLNIIHFCIKIIYFKLIRGLDSNLSRE
ncbi:uncharacterized protein LOC127783207 [Oryza glaberrima]|uniref:Uncharacterized protein n=2 Tax=Oryza TaxID=4527 RepID=A0A0D3H124_9ORYZ|nr:uncharacterized protein LOC127783207 [Oryza glaberrima]